MRFKISFKKLILFILAIILIGILGFVIWAKNIYHAEQNTLDLVLNNQNVTITETPNYWQVSPKNCDTSCTTGLIFYPGAKVDPKAYFYKFLDLIDKKNGNWKIFITKPTLNLAIFDINQADVVINENPSITKWILGGHSLGGAMGCEYVKNNTSKIKNLILIGSYCASDISKLDLHVVLIYGSLDGLLNPAKIAENKKNLPSDAMDILIEGMNHAQAGNYGKQSFDMDFTKKDEEVRKEIIEAIHSLTNK